MQTNSVAQEIKTSNIIDSIKLKANKATISFYQDFLRSKVEFADPNRYIFEAGAGLDSLFQFIGNAINDTCNLITSGVVPDGDIIFYKDSTLITEMDFVLSGPCRGLYSDFTKNTKKTHAGSPVGGSTSRSSSRARATSAISPATRRGSRNTLRSGASSFA